MNLLSNQVRGKNINQFVKNTYFNKDMNYYICSYGGTGSTVLFNYLANFGNVYHIHDRYPPKKLQYIGKENTNEDIYNEWFNGTEIPEEKLKNYKIIFIYRHPIPVIFSRFAQFNGPNIPHLKNIKCINNGNINIYDVVNFKKDFYGIEGFFDNYMMPNDRNYHIYGVKYESFWNNINLFNNVMGIPDIKKLYPIRQEHKKKIAFVNELNFIYSSLINKMNRMKFIEIVKPIKMEEKEDTIV
jgi:hypothetical protein